MNSYNGGTLSLLKLKVKNYYKCSNVFAKTEEKIKAIDRKIMDLKNMKNILFLCTGNSCRSQMAEGWGKKLKERQFNFYSAGMKKHGLNLNAVRVMQEVGVDISHHKSKITDELPNVIMDYIFTVCSDANENCPIFHGGKIIHIGFDDPPKLTKDMRSEIEILSVYRRVRDEIKDMVINIEQYLEG